MSISNATLNSHQPKLLSVLRIVTGLLFVPHGLQKLLGFFGGMNGGTAPLMSQPGIAGALELVGGTLLLLGLFTRPVAFVLSGLMASAYFIAHFPNGFLPLQNHGELAVLYCFVFLYFSVAGPGPWSLDNFFRKARGIPS